MDTIVWDQTFMTGLAGVDQQHQSLVSLFNELSDSFFDVNGVHDVLIEDIFSRLTTYARYHFSEEEALMREVGLDKRHQARHQRLHEAFTRQVVSMWGARSSMSHPSELFIGFITSWLGLHILGIDQDMSRQMAHIRNGQSPHEAYETESTTHHDSSAQALLRMVGKLHHMLSSQNAELARVNTDLEACVKRRTCELENANEALIQANRQLEVFSRTDGLLKIANRQYFDERLATECVRACRSRQPLGLLMIDVDFFKGYNDRYGHQAGDHCLQSLAGAVSLALLRPGDLLARYGGEELVVILPDTDLAGVESTAQRVCDAVAELKLLHSDSTASPYVTVSVGAASVAPDSSDAGSGLLALADQALYQAKAAGRNRMHVAVPVV